MRLIISLFIILIFLTANVKAQYIYPKRELRGAWIATVADIDWPSSNQEPSSEQIKELKELFNKLHEAGINTVFFQVRAECDAFYNSPYEPWSYWLTGTQGKAPDPYYDPLKLAVKEAHSHGMLIHAWLNPLRTQRKDEDFKLAANNIMNTHPGWILKFKDYAMLNPALPAVRHYVAKIAGDIARRYNVDGIHLDDYFYPYSKITNEDSASFIEYNNGINNIDDWRRNNINLMIKDVHDTVKAISPKIEFGTSPFGIIENKYAGTKGFEAYNVLYSDPLTWIKNKYVDYIVPQIYWEINNKYAGYKKLLVWWASVTDGVQLYAGVYSSKFASPDYDGISNEIENQLRLNRQIIKVDGTVFYSAKSIAQNYSGLADSLKMYFKYPSLVPVMKAIDNTPPLSPSHFNVTGSSGCKLLSWEKPALAADGDSAFLYVLYKFSSDKFMNLDDAENIVKIIPGNLTSYEDLSIYNEKDSSIVYALTAVDHFGNESKPVFYEYHFK